MRWVVTSWGFLHFKVNHTKFAAYAMQNTENYIYNLPYTVRQELCDYLDELCLWPKLVDFVKLYPDEAQKIRKQQQCGTSPTKEFLNIWGGTYNHTVEELFLVLRKCQLFHAMRLLQNCVHARLHRLMPVDINAAEAEREAQSNSNNVSNSNNLTLGNNPRVAHTTEPEQLLSGVIGSTVIQEVQTLEISYAELTEGTHNWTSKQLGKGGFGIVYKGYWQHIEVAIKVMNYSRSNKDTNVKVDIQQSLKELKYLNSHRHKNILGLYGYSIKGEKPCLVYELMKGGSLEQRIKAEKISPLTWKERFNICRGTAAGISYLHTSREILLIHGDIKPANILLDECLEPKIGDFGLARETLVDGRQVSQVYGTKFYLPPEYLKKRELSTAVDVYSFGVVLLETFTYKRAYDASRKEKLPDYIRKLYENNSADIFDGRIDMPTLGEEADMCNDILLEALKCTKNSPEERPTIAQVIATFDKYKSFII